jgi:HK97 family phage major capsid protein
MPTALETMAGELTAKRQKVAETFEAKKKEDGTYDMTREELEAVQAQIKEVDELGKKYQLNRDAEEWSVKNKAELEYLNRPEHPSRFGNGSRPGNDGAALQRKSLGELLFETKEAKEIYGGILERKDRFRPFRVDVDFDTKTTMAETGTGFSPPNYRTNIVVFSAQRRPVVADLIPQDPTDKETIKYMLETTYTNNAAMTAEAGSAPEVALGYTEQSVTVEWLPCTLPVTEQQLEDVPQLNGIINNRLTLMIQQAEETQLLTGTGSSPQLTGFLGAGVSGLQSQALGSDPVFDAFLKAMTLVRFTGFADPSGCIVNPNNWQTIRLQRTTIGDYIMGPPSTVGPDMLFGLPVVITPAISSGTALLGDFLKFSHISRRRGLRIEVGFVNDDFKRGQKTIRADERLCLEVYRPAAFCKVTGLQ